MILNRAKDYYYENEKERLREQARDTESKQEIQKLI